ncbi:MAG: glycoside hydrolase [Candidatus Sumerlaeia bacterium]|nr:glycoside hydrolase [Candidatus Sumerlaeia bacterium]
MRARISWFAMALAMAAAPMNRSLTINQIVCPPTAQYPRHSEGDTAVLKDGRLLLAWTEFEGGFADDAPAVIGGKVSADGGRTWGEKIVLQPNTGRRNVMSASLLRKRDGELLLFFLQKDGPDNLSVWMRRAVREPDLWTSPTRVSTLPGYHVMNNARVIELTSGRLLAPTAHTPDAAKQHKAMSCLCYLSDDGGATWRPAKSRIGFPESAAMEPGLVELKDGRVLMIIRTVRGCIYTSHSTDGCQTWSESKATSLTAPAAPASIARIPSTGDLLLIWANNPKGAKAGWKERTPLAAAISRDEGNTWSAPRNIEDDPKGSFGYCSIRFVGNDVLLTYYDWRDTGQKGFQNTSLRFRRLPVAWFYGK